MYTKMWYLKYEYSCTGIDDTLAIEDTLTVENLIENTRIRREEQFKFSKNKSKYMIFTNGKGKEKRGEGNNKILKKTEEYRHLRGWINERNNVKRQIEENRVSLWLVKLMKWIN